LSPPRSRRAGALFLVTAMLAALAPLAEESVGGPAATDLGFPGWPTHHDGRLLEALPLTRRELAFVQDFPGRVGRFSDGQHQIIIRWVGAPTRRLHPAVECFRGNGYKVEALPAQRDNGGAIMGCFRARRGTESLRVCELIRDERGQNWPDVSAWYWHALLGWTHSPWWSVVVATSDAAPPIPWSRDLTPGHEW